MDRIAAYLFLNDFLRLTGRKTITGRSCYAGLELHFFPNSTHHIRPSLYASAVFSPNLHTTVYQETVQKQVYWRLFLKHGMFHYTSKFFYSPSFLLQSQFTFGLEPALLLFLPRCPANHFHHTCQLSVHFSRSVIDIQLATGSLDFNLPISTANTNEASVSTDWRRFYYMPECHRSWKPLSSFLCHEESPTCSLTAV